MKVNFDQCMRLIVLIAGAMGFSVGIWMINKGIKAEGSIDISSEFLKGSIKSGSAGLFIVFFSFLMIMAAVLFPKWPVFAQPKLKAPGVSKVPTLRKITLLLLGLAVGSYFGMRYTTGGESVFLGFIMVGLFLASVIFSIGTLYEWETECEQRKKLADTNTPNTRQPIP